MPIAYSRSAAGVSRAAISASMWLLQSASVSLTADSVGRPAGVCSDPARSCEEQPVPNTTSTPAATHHRVTIFPVLAGAVLMSSSSAGSWSPVFAGERQLLDVEVAGGEAGAGVLQVEVPQAQEGRVEPELEHPIVRLGERGVPLPQRLGVVAPEGGTPGQL